MKLSLLLALSSTVAARLQIGILRKAESCEAQAQPGDEVDMHYVGKLADGSIFDESYQRGPLHLVLGQGRVIPGWEQGILGMCVGEKRRLIIPPELAYGERGSPPVIPPSATLTFDVELVELNGYERDL